MTPPPSDMAHSIRRVGAALILLAKAQPSSASAFGRPNWARLYSSSFRLRGGASTEEIGVPTSSDSNHPFGHLPGIEVGIVMRLTGQLSLLLCTSVQEQSVCSDMGRAHGFRASYSLWQFQFYVRGMPLGLSPFLI